ncbi:MAG: arylsulfatase [Bacteroidales bacterium]|nr:arylsulfatase [Bacteroidales bacterium]
MTCFKNFKIHAGIILLPALVGCNSNESQVEETKPNIIYILADDLGYGDLGSYGQVNFSTPYIDKLASEGMRFINHYSGSTVSAPSRSVLMTGLHSGHSPIRDNKEYKPEGQHPMADNAFTIAEMFKEEGYATGAFGKWGLGSVGTEGDPNNQGFDEFFGYNCHRVAHRYYPAYLWHNDQKVELPGNDWINTETYAPDVIQEKVLEFIESNKDQPFFLFYPNIIPHAELIAPEDEILEQFIGKFEETAFEGGNVKKIEEAAYGKNMDIAAYCPQENPKAVFAAMVTRLDKQVGEVMAKLKELGIDDNTIVIFTSDNGPHKEGGIHPDDFNSNGELRGLKRDLYEGGIRVPMIARWPGKINSGTETNHISAFWDVLPTFAEIAGTEIPGETDGISFLPILLEEEGQILHDHMYWEFHAQGGKQAVRKGNWKAVRLNYYDRTKTTVELYDLEKDPAESTDLAHEFPEIVLDMISIMDEEHSYSEDFPFDGVN